MRTHADNIHRQNLRLELKQVKDQLAHVLDEQADLLAIAKKRHGTPLGDFSAEQWGGIVAQIGALESLIAELEKELASF